MARRSKKTEEQMKLFEEGGLKDEGGTVDPVSGNDVPAGSTQAEVRDDIPAQLSEGEFVFPADVVRYIGLENLMELRSKAKQGLAKMEAMGQMGNSEEATMDDDGEYEGQIDDLIDNFDPNDPETMSFAEGGVVYAQQGTFVPGMPQQQFSYGYMPPQQQGGYQAPQVPTTQFPDYSQFVSRPAQSAVGEQRGITEQRQYIGPNGEMITILFMDGKPQQEIPAGYKVYKPEEVKPPEVVAPTVTPTTDGGGGGDGPEDSSPDMSGFDISIANDTLGMIGPDDPGFAGLNAATQAAQAAKTKAGLMGLVSFIAPFGIGAKAAEKAQKDYMTAEQKMRQELGKVQQTNPTYRAKMIEKAIEQMQDDFGISEQAATNIANEMDAVSRGEDFNIEDDAIPEQDTVTVDPVTGKISIGGKSLSDYGKSRDNDDAPSGPSGPPGGTTASQDPSEEGSTGAGGGGGGGGGGGQAGADAAGGASESSPFAKGGLAEQTQRALKSSRKKK